MRSRTSLVSDGLAVTGMGNLDGILLHDPGEEKCACMGVAEWQGVSLREMGGVLGWLKGRCGWSLPDVSVTVELSLPSHVRHPHIHTVLT